MPMTSNIALHWFTLCGLTVASGCSTTTQKAQALESDTPSQQCAQMMPMRGLGRAAQMGGWHPSSPYGQLYFQGKQTSLSGEISRIEPVVPRPSMMQGIQIALKTSDGNKIIHLGPSWYLEQQDFQLKIGDKVSVRGRLIDAEGSSFTIAENIQKGGETLLLRDESGFPLWAGVRMRGMPAPDFKTDKKPAKP